MTKSGSRKSWKELIEENRLLPEEVEVSRKAADITANLVIEQFVKSDEFVRMLQDKFEIEQKTKNFLAALHKTTLGLMSRLDLESLLKNLVVRATQLSNTPHGFIYLLNSEKTYLECKVGIGLFQSTIDLKLQRGEGMAGDIWKTGQPLCIADYDTWPGRSPRIEYNVFQSIIGVPLGSGGVSNETTSPCCPDSPNWLPSQSTTPACTAKPRMPDNQPKRPINPSRNSWQK